MYTDVLNVHRSFKCIPMLKKSFQFKLYTLFSCLEKEIAAEITAIFKKQMNGDFFVCYQNLSHARMTQMRACVQVLCKFSYGGKKYVRYT